MWGVNVANTTICNHNLESSLFQHVQILCHELGRHCKHCRQRCDLLGLIKPLQLHLLAPWHQDFPFQFTRVHWNVGILTEQDHIGPLHGPKGHGAVSLPVFHDTGSHPTSLGFCHDVTKNAVRNHCCCCRVIRRIVLVLFLSTIGRAVGLWRVHAFEHKLNRRWWARGSVVGFTKSRRTRHMKPPWGAPVLQMPKERIPQVPGDQ